MTHFESPTRMCPVTFRSCYSFSYVTSSMATKRVTPEFQIHHFAIPKIARNFTQIERKVKFVTQKLPKVLS